MTIQEAINFVDIARMNYICDPHECGLEKGKDPCTAFHCDEIHDALVMAIKALEKQIPKKADAEELDCKNCIWNDYPVYFKNKCVPCELLKCDCFSKVMYEEWSDMNE